MKLKHTPRGFSVVEFTDSFNTKCSIQEASSASESRIWLGVENHRMLLSQEEVKSLMPILQSFVETGELDKADMLDIDI